MFVAAVAVRCGGLQRAAGRQQEVLLSLLYYYCTTTALLHAACIAVDPRVRLACFLCVWTLRAAREVELMARRYRLLAA